MSLSQPLPHDAQHVLDAVRALLARLELAPPDVAPDAHLADDLELDSLDQIDLLLCLEEHFDVALRDGPLTAVQTVRDVAARVMAALGRPRVR